MNKIEIGGRKNGKRMARLLEFDENIRKGNFPILILRKPQEAVVISLEEYNELKKAKENMEMIRANARKNTMIKLTF